MEIAGEVCQAEIRSIWHYQSSILFDYPQSQLNVPSPVSTIYKGGQSYCIYIES